MTAKFITSSQSSLSPFPVCLYIGSRVQETTFQFEASESFLFKETFSLTGSKFLIHRYHEVKPSQGM